MYTPVLITCWLKAVGRRLCLFLVHHSVHHTFGQRDAGTCRWRWSWQGLKWWTLRCGKGTHRVFQATFQGPDHMESTLRALREKRHYGLDLQPDLEVG